MCARLGSFQDPIVLAGGVGYYAGFIPLEEADELFAALLKLEWTQHAYRGAGPDSPVCAWMGVPYVSADTVDKIAVTEWTPEVQRIKLLVEETMGCAFDSLNLHLYRDHRDCIDFHSDGQEEGPWNSVIACVSLGAERRFGWKNIQDGSTTTQLLEHGSLLLIPSGFRHEHRCESPKQQRPCGPRINLMFRRKAAP